jgi:hypothetical protein
MQCLVSAAACAALLCAAAYGEAGKPPRPLPGVFPARYGDAPYMLVAAESGLYKIAPRRAPVPLMTGGKVTHIVRTADAAGERWLFATSAGLLSSRDLKSFELCGGQIPRHIVKEYAGGETRFVSEAQSLKGVAANPSNPLVVAAATRDAVFLSRDGGRRWANLGYSAKSAGTKAVAVADMPAGAATETVVFLSNAIAGLSYIRIDDANPRWQDLSDGFEKVPTMGYADEIADILPVLRTRADGTAYAEVYLSQSFLPCVYRLDWEAKRAEKIYRGQEPTGTIEGLCWTGSDLLYTAPGGLSRLNAATGRTRGIPAALRRRLDALKRVPGPIYAAYIPQKLSGFAESLLLKELWLIEPDAVHTAYAAAALGKKSVYMPANHGASDEGISRYLDIVERNGLNSIVIDMKDDFGLLRFKPEDELLRQKGYVSQHAIRDDFIPRFKERRVYLIARVVVFKDRHLSQYGGGKYAVWDGVRRQPWVGIKSYGGENEDAEYYDGNWVDPYCEEVWEYNVRVAQELIRKGFDEIQFDYIRFPTDGLNLGQAQYRWRGSDMSKESALISFLRYARRNIHAPLGIDVYGANGWYRSGTRTGQDVELLAEYVDVICPMFYPSHFEQSFLAHAPAKDRPYRIYYFGTYRTSVIARNTVVARPWVQAFYLPVSYDNAYYNADPQFYIAAQVFGVRDSVGRGYMYWNNAGRYDDINPDIAEDAPYPGEDRSVPTPFKASAVQPPVSAQGG